MITSIMNDETNVKLLMKAIDESSLVALLDLQGKLTYVNARLCQLAGCEQSEWMGSFLQSLLSKEHSERFSAEIITFLMQENVWKGELLGQRVDGSTYWIKAGHIWRGEVKNRAKDGTGYWMNTTIVPFLDENKKPRQFISIRSEITDRIKAEEELAERTEQLARMRDEAVNASNVKSQFLANMSHELRTPLNAIIGYSEMLREEAEELGEPIFVEDLSKISKAGNHLLALINDVLDISKIEAGKMELHYELCTLFEFIQDVLVTMEPLIDEKGNTLVFEFECEQDEQLVTDVLKMRQILLNLLSNANKFTDKGIITLKVKSCSKNGHNGYIFIVQDTGIGMSEEQMTKLFQPFTQVDSSTTRKYGGTGLGLSISHRLINMLGGKIDVHSELGVGTAFTCWLPGSSQETQLLVNEGRAFGRDQQVIAVEDQASSADNVGVGEKVNIVLIDDELSNHYLMDRYIARTGWSIVHADHGIEGIKLIREYKPDVICLDILMPDMDGWSVLAALKEDKELAHIPVVWSMASDIQRCYELGVSEILTKPSERERLIEVISKYIKLD